MYHVMFSNLFNILLIYLPYNYLFVYKLFSQRPSRNGVEVLIVYNPRYSMGLAFYTMEILLFVLTIMGKHLLASFDLHNLLNEINRHQQNLLRFQQ